MLTLLTIAILLGAPVIAALVWRERLRKRRRREVLAYHASVYGLGPIPGETDGQLRARVLAAARGGKGP